MNSIYQISFLNMAQTAEAVRKYSYPGQTIPHKAIEHILRGEKQLDKLFIKITKDKLLDQGTKAYLNQRLAEMSAYLYLTKKRVYCEVRDHLNTRFPFWISELVIKVLKNAFPNTPLSERNVLRRQLDYKCEAFVREVANVYEKRISQEKSFSFERQLASITHLKTKGAFLWEEIERLDLSEEEKLTRKSKISKEIYFLADIEESMKTYVLDDLLNECKYAAQEVQEAVDSCLFALNLLQ